MAIFVARPQVSDDFSWFYCFFPDTRHVSDVPFSSDEMCTSQGELQIFLKIDDFS